MKINLVVTVKGDEVTFDFTGSSPQTPGFVNAPYSATASALMLTFLMLINPDIPHNAGLLRPLKIVIDLHDYERVSGAVTLAAVAQRPPARPERRPRTN